MYVSDGVNTVTRFPAQCTDLFTTIVRLVRAHIKWESVLLPWGEESQRIMLGSDLPYG